MIQIQNKGESVMHFSNDSNNKVVEDEGWVWFNFLILCFLKKWQFQKVQWNWVFFFFFLSEKTECLTSTYKSGGLSCKLPKWQNVYIKEFILYLVSTS